MLATRVHDLRHAGRSLWRTPGFTAAAVLTLAVGIGANTAIFSVFEAALLRPLPYADSDRLVAIHETGRNDTPIPVNALHFEEWRANLKSFDSLALLGPVEHTLTGSGDPVRLDGVRVTPSVFPTLAIVPALGRAFLDEENIPGRDDVVILTHELWTARFNGDPSIVGRSITLDGLPHVVVGVLPANRSIPKLGDLYGLDVEFGRAQFFKPFAATENDLRMLGSFNYAAIGRIRAGVSASQALAELNAVQQDLARRAPEPARFGAIVIPLADQIADRSRLALQLVLGTVVLVLLIACVNIANLLLARGGRRAREFAIRRAAGAERRDLILHVLAESLVLSLAAGVAGLAIGSALIELIRQYAPPTVPRLDEAAVNVSALAFTFAVTLVSGISIGIVPAFRSTALLPVDVLRSSAATSASGVPAARLRSTLVAVEVAVSTACVVAAALLLSSFVNLLNVDRGFDTSRIVTVTFSLAGPRYDTPAKGLQFMTTLADRMRQLPGVTSVGVTDALPLNGVANSAIMIEGSTLPRQQRPTATVRVADRDYFRTMGIPLHAGRVLEDADADRRVAVISELAAQRLWPGQNPLGKKFRHGPDTSPLIEVVGVVGNVRSISLSANPPLHIYRPGAQYLSGGGSIAARTTSDPTALAPAIGRIVRQLDPELPVPAPRTMDDIVAESVAQRRFQMNLMLLLGAAAVLLAGLGIYAVVSQSVSQRTSEFGIRMALGADASRIGRLVLRQGLLPVVFGLIAGIGVSLAGGRLLKDLLFGVSATDAVPLVLAAMFLFSVAVTASLAPAWRASRLDPNTALRAE
ncbi:MAG TPA: ABC transporter permease [Vicinamibacterales bacterium]|nr:ABC transporter permease [Vicinamibacterales bacterium]